MGRSDFGDSRIEDADRSKLRLVVYPQAFHSFDNVELVPGRRYLGHWLEYNASATAAAVEDIRAFLSSVVRDVR